MSSKDKKPSRGKKLKPYSAPKMDRHGKLLIEGVAGALLSSEYLPPKLIAPS